jgi:GcrA cell cycle regulator
MLSNLFDLPRPPRPRAASPWTEKRLRYLRRRWSEGARAREIGAALGVSANAVIAKIHRLGIARLSPYGGAPGRRLALRNIPPAARPQYARRGASSSRRAPAASPLLPDKHDLENARLDAQIPLPQRRSLLALRDDSCRWPVGEPASPSFFFCGGEVARNKPYCAVHCARAYRAPQARRDVRAAAWGGRRRRGATAAGGH